MTEQIFPLGKLDMAFLAEMLNRYTDPHPRVVIGAQVGEDAAVIDFGDRYLVAKTDPITFATDQIGWYAVQVNANDLATMGATPRWLLITLLLPEDHTTRSLVEGIFRQVHEACHMLDIALVGGHTEVTYGLDRPIVVGQLLGEVDKDKLVSTRGAQVGDAIILAKGIAIEGTAIIARERADDLRQRGYSQEWIERAQHMLFDPGISILREARLAATTGYVHAMHDPTEGGLATGLHELARAAGVGVLVDEAVIPVLPECQELCRAYNLDPLGTIASGALLLTAAADAAPRLVAALKDAGTIATTIGRIMPADEGIKIKRQHGIADLPRFDQDEITRLF